MAPVPDGGTSTAIQPHQVLPGCCSLQDGACAIPSSTAGVLDVGLLARRKGLEVVGCLVMLKGCIVPRAGHGLFAFPQQPRPPLAHLIERRIHRYGIPQQMSCEQLGWRGFGVLRGGVEVLHDGPCSAVGVQGTILGNVAA